MGVDFSGLVLAPAMAVFGLSVTVTPQQSQPGAAPYPARGIWTVDSINITLESGAILSSVNLKLGIRLADFTLPPQQGDWITVDPATVPLTYWQGEIVPTDPVDFVIDNFTPDGQGKADLVLKLISAP